MKKLTAATDTATSKAKGGKKAKGVKPAATVTPINVMEQSAANAKESADTVAQGVAEGVLEPTAKIKDEFVSTLEEGATYGDTLSAEEIAELKASPNYAGSEAQLAEAVSTPATPVKESAVDRWLDKMEAEKEAKLNPPAATDKPVVVTVEKPAATAKPAAPAKNKSSRFATTAITLVNPEAASPAWKGKRGEAFGVIETYYTELDEAVNAGERKADDLLTVGKWLEIVVATPSLSKVGFEFLRFYEAEGLIKLTPVEVVKPAATEVKAEA